MKLRAGRRRDFPMFRVKPPVERLGAKSAPAKREVTPRQGYRQPRFALLSEPEFATDELLRLCEERGLGR
jgi:hypothetical protein